MSLFKRTPKPSTKPAVDAVATDAVDVLGAANGKYFDIDEIRDRAAEAHAIRVVRTKDFFKRIDYLFMNSGIDGVLRKNVPDKVHFENTNEFGKNRMVITFGWKPAAGVTVLCRIESSGYYLPDLIPDEFVSPKYPLKYHLFKHKVEISMVEDGATMTKSFELPVTGAVVPTLPTWFVAALQPLVKKA